MGRTPPFAAVMTLIVVVSCGSDGGMPTGRTSSSNESGKSSTTSLASPAVPARIDLPEGVSGLEGIAVDPDTKRVLVSDTSTGAIWAGRLDNKPFETFIEPETTTAVGLAADTQRRLLYVATGPEGQLDVHNLDSGELVEQIDLPVVANSFVNDVAVAPDGTVYVTDSGVGRLFVHLPETATAKLFLDLATTNLVDASAPQLQLNGVVADDSTVLVNHMASASLLRVDRETAEVSVVDVQGADSAGRDGLLLCDDLLYGAEVGALNGGNEAIRVTKLSPDRSEATAQEPIGLGDEASAATIAYLDGRLIVTNSQFGLDPPQLPFWLTTLPATC